jgi:hypothetical protein
MSLETGVRLDAERGTYVYYVLHDGAEIVFLERKTGNVDKRREAAKARAEEAAAAPAESQSQG